MNSWFRMYNSVVHDPKVQRLPADDFKTWVNLLCLASENDGILPADEDIAFALHVTLEAALHALHQLENFGLLEHKNGTWRPHNWNKRQFKSDSSSDRVKRYRKRFRNVTVTPPEQTRTDTDTDTEQNINPSDDAKVT